MELDKFLRLKGIQSSSSNNRNRLQHMRESSRLLLRWRSLNGIMIIARTVSNFDILVLDFFLSNSLSLIAQNFYLRIVVQK